MEIFKVSLVGDGHCLLHCVQASQVVGQYLALDKDEARFKAWIQDSSSANSKQQNDCYTSVKEWCENHVQ